MMGDVRFRRKRTTSAQLKPFWFSPDALRPADRPKLAGNREVSGAGAGRNPKPLCRRDTSGAETVITGIAVEACTMIQDHLPLIRGLIAAFLFLESSGPNEINPDSAVRCMENISADLLALSLADQIELRLHLNKIADESEDTPYKNFVRALPDMIGLASP